MSESMEAYAYVQGAEEITGPEVVLSESRSTLTFIAPTAQRLITSPEWEVHSILDSPNPADHSWTPPWEEVSTLLHAIPPTVTRLSVRFERRGG
jgi:hypothetical protein